MIDNYLMQNSEMSEDSSREQAIAKIISMDYDEFRNHTIGQDDDCDYDESGYVALKVGNYAFVSHYSHCSCYGTHSAIFPLNESDFVDKGHAMWFGKYSELVEMAKGKMDIAMPDRKADKKDYDYDHLCNMYDEVLEWEKVHGST